MERSVSLQVRTDCAMPAPRTGHALLAQRESVFLFGGLTERGLSSELWVLDLDSLAWSQVRKRPSLLFWYCFSERRLSCDEGHAALLIASVGVGSHMLRMLLQ